MAEEDKTAGRPYFKVQPVLGPRAQVEQQLKEAIVGGQILQGAKLPTETELAHQFGVSRPTIREALGGLASASLIRKVPGIAGGSFVNIVNAESLSEQLRESVTTSLRHGTVHITELTQVRRSLEIPSAQWAAANRSEDQLESLRATLDRQRSTTTQDPEIHRFDREFHSTIGQASGNRLLAAFIAAIHGATHPTKYLRIADDVARVAVKQHAAILDALVAQDADRAGEAMGEHLDFVMLLSWDYPGGSP